MTTRIEVPANPEVLQWARRMSGLEVEDAARKARVNERRLQEWEAGDTQPTINQLRRLADVYKRPWAVFLLRAVPADEPLPGDYRRFAPGAFPSVSPELRAAVRSAYARREALIEICKDLRRKPPALNLVAELGDDPEDVGARIRDKIVPQPTGTDARSVFNAWRTAVDQAGVLVFQADRIDLDEMRGFSISDRPFPAAVLNMQDAYQARTFTLLHEVGHILLGRGGVCLLDEVGPNTDFRQIEMFCNHAAGATLVPAERLLAEAEVPKRTFNELPDHILLNLARRYGVSAEVITRRLLALGRVSTAFYQRKRAAFLEQYKEMRRRKQSGFAHPATLAAARNGRAFTRLVLEAFDEERLTASDVADLLNIRLKHLDHIRRAMRPATPGEDGE